MRTLALTAALALAATATFGAAQARTCTERYDRCVSVCMTSGVGKSRADGVTRPMSADVAIPIAAAGRTNASGPAASTATCAKNAG